MQTECGVRRGDVEVVEGKGDDVHHEIMEREHAKVTNQGSPVGYMRSGDGFQRGEAVRVEQEVERFERG